MQRKSYGACLDYLIADAVTNVAELGRRGPKITLDGRKNLIDCERQLNARPPFPRNVESIARRIRKTRLDSASFKWKLSELQKSAKQKRKCVSNLTFPLVTQSLGRLPICGAFSARLGKNKRITQKRSSHYESWKRASNQ